MTSAPNSLTFQQQASMSNANTTVCEPIPFDTMLQQPVRFTPKTVRRYLWQVVERLNHYFSIWMDGPNMCKIRVIRNGRTTAQVVVNLSVWRAKQLFPRMVCCKWVDQDGKKKTLFRNVIDLFLQARNRKEIYHESQPFTSSPLQHSHVVEWLQTQLALPEECCSIKWGGLNTRQMLYDSFLENMLHPEDWSPKRISQAYYKLLPSCRPDSGKRVRRMGVASMYIPTRERCSKVLERWAQIYQPHGHLHF